MCGLPLMEKNIKICTCDSERSVIRECVKKFQGQTLLALKYERFGEFELKFSGGLQLGIRNADWDDGEDFMFIFFDRTHSLSYSRNEGFVLKALNLTWVQN
jgi:hypothetical protein